VDLVHDLDPDLDHATNPDSNSDHDLLCGTLDAIGGMTVWRIIGTTYAIGPCVKVPPCCSCKRP